MFARLGWQHDAAAVDYDGAVSGGLAVCGRAWGREHDAIGLGLAWLDGGNGQYRSARIGELFAAFALGDGMTLTGDVQYADENIAANAGPSPRAWTFGIRMTLDF